MTSARRDPAVDGAHRLEAKPHEETAQPPPPSPKFRRRAWREFQRAIDPLAPPKPLPPGRR